MSSAVDPRASKVHSGLWKRFGETCRKMVHATIGRSSPDIKRHWSKCDAKTLMSKTTFFLITGAAFERLMVTTLQRKLRL